MNPSVLEMDPQAAADKYSAFANSKRHGRETALAAEIYRLLSEGRKLVDVGVAIRDAGTDELDRPRLAIARAHRKQVCVTWSHYEDTVVFNANDHEWQGRQYRGFIERINFNRTPTNFKTGYAVVPMIPADISLGGWRPMDLHILWEVEAWADQRIGAKPPIDPYLLRRVDGELFVIIAEWELTEVERYVMAGRARVQQ